MSLRPRGLDFNDCTVSRMSSIVNQPAAISTAYRRSLDSQFVRDLPLMAVSNRLFSTRTQDTVQYVHVQYYFYDQFTNHFAIWSSD